MKRIITTVILALSLTIASAAFGADGVKLGSVDIQKVLLNSDSGKEAKEQLALKANKYEAEKNSREEELKKLKAELEKRGFTVVEGTPSYQGLVIKTKISGKPPVKGLLVMFSLRVVTIRVEAYQNNELILSFPEAGPTGSALNITPEKIIKMRIPLIGKRLSEKFL